VPARNCSDERARAGTEARPNSMSIPIDTIDDERLTPFRLLKDRDLAREHGLFIAEGEHLLKRLLASPVVAHSIFLSTRRADEIASIVPDGIPVYVGSDEVMRGVIGYKFHSGVIAAGVRPAPRGIDDAIPRDRHELTLVVLPEIANAENLGSLFRIAAGFGADAVVLGERSADPFWRQCVRVSMGTVFSLAVARSDDLLSDLNRLRHEWGVSIVGTVLSDGAEPLSSFRRDPKTAVLFGNEAQGLDGPTIAACDRLVTIPMKLGTDSLNVAVASGIVMYELTRR
jgi:tRNA G18 (ribose-2'-O)-methylase SpoU